MNSTLFIRGMYENKTYFQKHNVLEVYICVVDIDI